MIIRYGGFWRRFAALTIDTIILYLFIIILSLIGTRLMPINNGFTWVRMIPYYGMALIINAVYFTYFHGISGQTPGKRMLGLRVVQAGGAPMTPEIAFLRWVGYIISKVPLFLGFIWAAFDGSKQGWHDKIAGTCVIRTGSYGEAEDRVPPDVLFEPHWLNTSAAESALSGNGDKNDRPPEEPSDGKNT
jgi:uncharacterized RDD family membrane protein YckC